MTAMDNHPLKFKTMNSIRPKNVIQNILISLVKLQCDWMEAWTTPIIYACKIN